MQISKTLLTLGAVAIFAGMVSQAAPDNEAQAKAREALHKKMTELDIQAGWKSDAAPKPGVPDNEAQAKAREKLRKRIADLAEQSPTEAPNTAPAPIVFESSPGPSTNLASTKEARLAELLKQYKADAVTPEQYHKERAKILAEP